MTDPRHDAGMAVRREVLGAEHVDRAGARATSFSAPFQEYITRCAWGEVWTRPGLDRRMRSAITLALLTAGGHEAELALHVRAALVRQEGLEAIVDAVLARWFTAGVPTGYREMFLSTDRESYARCCDALASWDARDELARIDTPTLCVAGADDPSTPPEHLESIARAIPRARLETIARARHLANVERADEFNRLLTEFL